MARAKHQLSYEELEKRLAEAQEKNRILEGKNKNLEEKNKTLKAKNKTLQGEVNHLKTAYQVFTDTFNEIALNILEKCSPASRLAMPICWCSVRNSCPF